MALVLDIVQRSYRKLGILAGDEELQADDISRGVEALNAMMHGWKLRSVDLEHTDVASSDDFPLAPEYEEGVTYLLADRLSPDYTIPKSFDADDWFRTFQAAHRISTKVTMPNGILYTPTGRRRWTYEI